MTTKATFALLLVALVAAPTAVASPPGMFEATRVTLTRQAAVAGDLEALMVLHPQAGDGTTLHSNHPPSFEVAGTHVTVTEYRTHDDVAVLGKAVSTAPQDTASATALTHALAYAEANDDDFVVFIGPLAGGAASLVIEGGSLGLGASAGQRVAMTHLENHTEGAGPARDVGRSHALVERGSGATAHVAGDFVVSLWSVDLRAEADEGAREFRSGFFPTFLPSVAPNQPAIDGVGPQDSIRLDIEVRDGRLAMPLGSDWDLTTLLQAQSAVSAGPVRLSGAVPVKDGVALAPRQDVEVQGPLRGSFDDLTGSRMRLLLSDATAQEVEALLNDPAQLAGEAVQVGRAGQPAGLWRAMAWGAAVAVATGIALAATVAGRRRWSRLRDLFESGRYDEVPALGRRVRRGRHAGEAAVMVGIALLKSGRLREAADHMRSPQLVRRGDPAARDFLAACLAVLQGDEDGATERLLSALRRDPGYAHEAVHAPWLEGILRRPVFRAYVSPAGARTTEEGFI